MSSRNVAQLSPAERELVITRVFDAPRELVFRMWTDPRHLMRRRDEYKDLKPMEHTT